MDIEHTLKWVSALLKCKASHRGQAELQHQLYHTISSFLDSSYIDEHLDEYLGEIIKVSTPEDIDDFLISVELKEIHFIYMIRYCISHNYPEIARVIICYILENDNIEDLEFSEDDLEIFKEFYNSQNDPKGFEEFMKIIKHQEKKRNEIYSSTKIT